MDIKNKTTKPLRLPLEGGKRCFIVPGGKGQIAPKQLEEPAIKALLADGSIEIQGVPPRKQRGKAASEES
ncbi:MAG: hypothetical protein ACJA0P_002658 [Planctomycetota bacterium]|jgi:hypothetical protein